MIDDPLAHPRGRKNPLIIMDYERTGLDYVVKYERNAGKVPP
jgi:hypothetical protein